MVKKIASNNSSTDETLFPNIENNRGNCFFMTGGTSEPTFTKISNSFEVACRYDSGERDSCRNYLAGDEIFRVFCITNESVSSTGLVVGKVITGLSECSSDNENGKCKIQDYEYFLGVKTDQKN